jgi:hypothetical protein
MCLPSSSSRKNFVNLPKWCRFHRLWPYFWLPCRNSGDYPTDVPLRRWIFWFKRIIKYSFDCAFFCFFQGLYYIHKFRINEEWFPSFISERDQFLRIEMNFTHIFQKRVIEILYAEWYIEVRKNWIFKSLRWKKKMPKVYTNCYNNIVIWFYFGFGEGSRFTFNLWQRKLAIF